MKYANLNTKQLVEELPKQIGSTWNPTLAQLQAGGWREITLIGEAPAGCIVTAYGIEETSGSECRLTVVSYVDPVAEAEAAYQAKLATITPLLLTQAGMFRTIMRKYFGVTAETDRAVTYTVVSNTFMAKQANGTITTQEIADMFVLEKLYAIVIAWTGDGTTWSFPWQLLDQ